MIRLIGAFLWIIVLSACSDVDGKAEEIALYEAVLIHADSAINYQTPVRVHPETFPFDMDEARATMWWGETKSAQVPENDAIRQAIAHTPSFTECTMEDHWCAIRPGETALILSGVNREGKLPRIGVAVYEKTESSFGARIYLATLSEDSGDWVVESIQWHSVIN